jgi:hypothetical protein
MTRRTRDGHRSHFASVAIMQPTISTFFKTRNKRSISPIDLTGDDPSLQHISKKPKHPDTTQLDKWSFIESPEVNQHKESPQDDTHSTDDEGEESREPSTRSHRAPAVKTRKDMVGKPYTPLEMQVGLNLPSSALYNNHNSGAGAQEKVSRNASHDRSRL